MNAVYFLPMFLAGFILKIIDDIYDRNLSDQRFGLLLSIIAVPLGIWLMLDVQGFILVGAIFWTTLFRGKVDNPGFKAGYLFTAILWAGLYLYFVPFVMDIQVLGSLGICILSIILTTVFHDIFKKQKTFLWDFLIEERFMIVLLDIPVIMLGKITTMGLIGITLLVGGYSIGGKVTRAFEKRHRTKRAIGRKVIISE